MRTGLIADVTDFAAVRRAAEDVANRFGRCDHVVFAVGLGSGKFGFPFWKLEPADWERVLKVNLIGAVNVAHAFAPAMAEAAHGTRRAGHPLSTRARCSSSPPSPARSARRPTRRTAPPRPRSSTSPSAPPRTWRHHGVRVNTLCPGMVQTPLNRGVYEAWAREQPESERPTYEAWTADKIQKLVPLNRWQQPEDIAAMAVFLASSQARNITGQTINVDGGYVMHW